MDFTETHPDIKADRPCKTMWFWNGRLIPEADWDFLQEVILPKSRKIENFQRVKVLAFVDGVMGVSKNKQHIDKGCDLVRKLEQMRASESSSLTGHIRNWLTWCHMHLDEEVSVSCNITSQSPF